MFPSEKWFWETQTDTKVQEGMKSEAFMRLMFTVKLRLRRTGVPARNTHWRKILKPVKNCTYLHFAVLDRKTFLSRDSKCK